MCVCLCACVPKAMFPLLAYHQLAAHGTGCCLRAEFGRTCLEDERLRNRRGTLSAITTPEQDPMSHVSLPAHSMLSAAWSTLRRARCELCACMHLLSTYRAPPACTSCLHLLLAPPAHVLSAASSHTIGLPSRGWIVFWVCAEGWVQGTRSQQSHLVDLVRGMQSLHRLPTIRACPLHLTHPRTRASSWGNRLCLGTAPGMAMRWQ